MSPTGVDVFEPVEVHEEHRNGFPVSLGLAHSLLQAFAKQDAVREFGKCVVVRQPLPLLLALFDFSDIGKHADVMRGFAFVVLYRPDGHPDAEKFIALATAPDLTPPVVGGLNFLPHFPVCLRGVAVGH